MLDRLAHDLYLNAANLDAVWFSVHADFQFVTLKYQGLSLRLPKNLSALADAEFDRAVWNQHRHHQHISSSGIRLV